MPLLSVRVVLLQILYPRKNEREEGIFVQSKPPATECSSRYVDG